MNKQSSSCAPKSCLVHGPQGCGKSTNARAIAKALGLSNILDNWQAGAPVPLLDTLVLTNADNPRWYFKGRVMTFDQAMQITQPGGDTPAGERSMTNNAHRWECVELDGDELHSCKKCRRQTQAPAPKPTTARFPTQNTAPPLGSARPGCTRIAWKPYVMASNYCAPSLKRN